MVKRIAAKVSTAIETGCSLRGFTNSLLQRWRRFPKAEACACAEAPLSHGCTGIRGGIPEQRASGAEARIFSSLNGTTEVVPFPISHLDRGAEALRHPKALDGATGVVPP